MFVLCDNNRPCYIVISCIIYEMYVLVLCAGFVVFDDVFSWGFFYR